MGAVVMVVPSKIKTPLASVPKTTLALDALLSIEFGAAGRVMAVPAVFVPVAIGIRDVLLLLATYTVVELVPAIDRV